MQTTLDPQTIQSRAIAVRNALPPRGLFAGMNWRISPTPFYLSPALVQELQALGRILLQFNRSLNLLHRLSLSGKQPTWIAEYLDRGKPAELLALQSHPSLKNELPRVIRPDLLLTENGFSITELDSVPGGIGLTAWLNATYAEFEPNIPLPPSSPPDRPARRSEPIHPGIIGGERGMLDGFASIFADAPRVKIVVSEEASSYRPEMEWIAGHPGNSHFEVCGPNHETFTDGDAVYRFFELFDLKNVPAASRIFSLALEKRIRLTPPPKPLFEEKIAFGLLWNRNLREFWRQELGQSFLDRLQSVVPFTWILDPRPIPPHAAIPELNLTSWHQLKLLSQKERELILKISGFSELGWGARSVSLGSDLPAADWSSAVDQALRSFDTSPYVLQRYEKPALVDGAWFDFDAKALQPMPSRVRLCPYYFVQGEGDAARAQLGGVLATLCPADKKIIHGMRDAILAPCALQRNAPGA